MRKNKLLYSAENLFDKTFLTGTFFALDKILNTLGAASPKFKEELAKQNVTVQLKLRDNSKGRFLRFEDGTVTGRDGVWDGAQVEMVFENENIARKVMLGEMLADTKDFVNAAKNINMVLNGPDEQALWFASLLLKVFAFDVLYLGDYGVTMKNGEKRYVTGTNGGPLFVYVKDGKIVRVTPIDFDQEDAGPWTVTAHGQRFTPPSRTTATAYAMSMKSLVYSPDRLLYPMKRVDWDPNGERHPETRGISGYERISWEQALDIVAGEIARVRQTHGPGSVFWSRGSHHLWGSVGYFTSAAGRFFNCIGASSTLYNPDSWEGFAWGGMHHMGGSARRGGVETYSTVEDCLQNAEFVVFWSSDPESTSGVYGAFEGSIRRQWLKKLKVPVVHIDPYLNGTAAFMSGRWIAPRPGSDAAMAIAIAYVWMTQGLYDKDFVAKRTLGFEKWEDYVLGRTDGVAKTPEWQEEITGIKARVVRALAEYWGSHKTYLACGGITCFGGACRTHYGTEWARAMYCLQAMQGFGNPGVNFGGLQYGTPLDTHFWFPGYAEGGFSGDFNTGAGIQVYNRMPQSPSVNSEYQALPRLRLPEAIMEGEAEAYNLNNLAVHGQFCKVHYPAPGHSPVKLYYKYGGSYFGTQPESNRFADMYRCDSLECVVNQSIWNEGEARFADIILPACTNFERWDIGENANCGGYIEKSYLQNNHRVVFMQHKCIEPLGESRSDFDIFQGIANRLGLWQVYSEGMGEYDWVRRLFDSTDLPSRISWKQFMRKGYYVVPPIPEDRRDPLALNWFAQGRKKDTPELTPLPSESYGRYNEGLQTPSGKFEFEAQTLKRFDPDDKERLPICTYIPPVERAGSDLAEKYPLQLISPHSRYSFHTMADGKNSTINDIDQHRVLVDGWRYWIFRMNPADAQARGLKHGDLVEVYNDRGSVVCWLDVTQRVPAGVVHSYESCSDYRPNGEPGHSPEMAGCINVLTSKRNITKHAHGLSVNSCLVEVKKWEGEENKWKRFI